MKARRGEGIINKATLFQSHRRGGGFLFVMVVAGQLFWWTQNQSNRSNINGGSRDILGTFVAFRTLDNLLWQMEPRILLLKKKKKILDAECLAINLQPRAVVHLGYAAGWWSTTHQQAQLSVAYSKAVLESNSQAVPQPLQGGQYWETLHYG